jgi:hypothetical protein
MRLRHSMLQHTRIYGSLHAIRGINIGIGCIIAKPAHLWYMHELDTHYLGLHAITLAELRLWHCSKKQPRALHASLTYICWAGMHQTRPSGPYRWQSRRSVIPLAASTLPPAAAQPPKTCSDTVRQAREALRRFRDAKAASQYVKANEAEPYRVIIELPLPVRPSLLNTYKGGGR